MRDAFYRERSVKIPPRLRSFAEKTFQQIAARSGMAFAVRYAEGDEWRSPHCSASAAPEFTLVFRKPRAYWRMALYGHVGLLEAYFDGDVDLEGSLQRALAAGMAGGADRPHTLLVRLREQRCTSSCTPTPTGCARSTTPSSTTRSGRSSTALARRSADALHLRLLDRKARARSRRRSANKLDHVGRKVLLEPGDDVVDIGCGFGGFLLLRRGALRREGHRLQHHATRRSSTRGARSSSGACKQTSVVEGDFRSMDRQYDKVVSIGCLEHAGRDSLADLIRAHARSLKPGGLGLIHFIGHVGQFETDYFIRKYVFPGGWIPSLADVDRRDGEGAASRCSTSRTCAATTR